MRNCPLFCPCVPRGLQPGSLFHSIVADRACKYSNPPWPSLGSTINPQAATTLCNWQHRLGRALRWSPSWASSSRQSCRSLFVFDCCCCFFFAKSLPSVFSQSHFCLLVQVAVEDDELCEFERLSWIRHGMNDTQAVASHQPDFVPVAFFSVWIMTSF